VALDDLGDLQPDPQDWVERRHRVLEDHGDLPAAQGTAPLGIHVQQVVAVVVDPAGHVDACTREQTHDRQRGDGLAAARLTHQADVLAGPNGEGHVAHRMQRRGASTQEGDRQVVDRQQRTIVALPLGRPGGDVGGAHRRCLGSSASRSASPSRVKPSAVTAMHTPG
jgi:hypothetical protein